MQCILVKSDEFENLYSFYIFFSNPDSRYARSAAIRKTQHVVPKQETRTHLLWFRIVPRQLKGRNTRSRQRSRMKTRKCQLLWASAARLNGNPRTSATQTRKSWSGSSWKSWRGAGKHSCCSERGVHARQYSPVYRKRQPRSQGLFPSQGKGPGNEVGNES